jgi:hypothetical protein
LDLRGDRLATGRAHWSPDHPAVELEGESGGEDVNATGMGVRDETPSVDNPGIPSVILMVMGDHHLLHVLLLEESLKRASYMAEARIDEQAVDQEGIARIQGSAQHCAGHAHGSDLTLNEHLEHDRGNPVLRNGKTAHWAVSMEGGEILSVRRRRPEPV